MTPRHSWPDTDVEVLRVIVDDVLHLGNVDADSAIQGRYSGLETGAGAVGDDGNVFGVAELADLRDEEQ